MVTDWGGVGCGCEGVGGLIGIKELETVGDLTIGHLRIGDLTICCKGDQGVNERAIHSAITDSEGESGVGARSGS